ncbi:hypothetical protein D3C72_2337260 [compost metagenome]
MEQRGEADPGPGRQLGQGHEGQHREGDDAGADLDQRSGEEAVEADLQQGVPAGMQGGGGDDQEEDRGFHGEGCPCALGAGAGNTAT